MTQINKDDPLWAGRHNHLQQVAYFKTKSDLAQAVGYMMGCDHLHWMFVNTDRVDGYSIELGNSAFTRCFMPLAHEHGIAWSGERWPD